MTTKNIVPRATGEGSLGTAAKKWGNIYADYITLADGETLQTKIANQNTRITTAEGTVTTLSGDVTTLYGSVETLSSGKVSVSTYNTDMAGKVDKSGGTFTSNLVIKRDVDSGTVDILGGTDNNSANLTLIGKNAENYGGNFRIMASNGTNTSNLNGNPIGNLSWSGNEFNIGSLNGGIYSYNGNTSYPCGSYATVLFIGLLQNVGSVIATILVNGGTTAIYNTISGQLSNYNANINAGWADGRLTINTNGAAAMVIVSNCSVE